MPQFSSNANGNIYVGATAPSGQENNSIFIDTDDTGGIIYVKRNGVNTQVGKSNFAAAAIVSHSTTIGDYTTPSAVTASSNTSVDTTLPANSDLDFTEYADQSAFDTAWASSDTAKIRGNPTNDNIDFNSVMDSSNDSIAFDVFGAAVSDTLWTVRFKLRFSTLTSGSGYATYIGMSSVGQGTASNSAQDFIGMIIRKQNNTYQATDSDGAVLANPGDATQALTWATATDYFFEIKRTSSTAYTVARYSDGTYASVSDSVNGTCLATTAGLRYFVIRNDIATAGDVHQGTLDNFQFWQGAPFSVIDNDTATYWQSTSAANSNVYVDLGSSVNVCALAFYWGSSSTETQIRIQTSTDAATWSTVRTITTSNLTADAYNYYRFNIKTARYVRIYGSSGSAGILQIYEAKALVKTDAQILADLGVLEISSTDTSLDGDAL